MIKRKTEDELDNLFSWYWKREIVQDRRERKRQIIEERSGSLLRKEIEGIPTEWKKGTKE